MQKAFNVGLLVAVVTLAAGLAYSIATRPEPGPSVAEVNSIVSQAFSEQPAPGPSAAEVNAMISQAFSEQPEPGPSADDVRSIVAQAIADAQPDEAPAPEPVDNAAIEALIEDYLIANPRILERMSAALESEMRTEETERSRLALTSFEHDIYNDPDNIVLGNPDGDVTLVELFDYNCGYCRQVVADVLSLVEEDPDLRVILKEFPILSQGSVDAARIGILVNASDDVDYRDFHMELFSARGAINTEAALAAASKLGLSRVALELDMNAAHVTEALQRTYAIAQGLGISGTPTFIIGDEVIPGAVSKDELTRRIANMRECGQTLCPSDG